MPLPTAPPNIQPAETAAFMDDTVSSFADHETRIDTLEAATTALDDLTDVDVSTTPPTDGQALVYDDGSSLWLPGTIAGGSVATDAIFDAKGDIVAATGANAASRVAVGTNGQVLTADSAEATGVKWATPSSGAGSPPVFVRRTAGNFTLNSTTWANVTATALDLTVAAVAGDVIEVGLSSLNGNEAPGLYLDMATIVAAATVNYIGTGGAESGTSQGIAAWQGGANRYDYAGGSIPYTVQAGDISGGNVLLRLRYRTSSAANKTLFADADHPLHVWAKNHG